MPTIELSDQDFGEIIDLLINWKEGSGNYDYDHWDALQERFENSVKS